MKSILLALCTVLALSFAVHADDQAMASPFMKSCLLKSSRFDRWVGKTTKYLFEKSSVAQTVAGPVQYVWHGNGPVILSLHGGFGGWDQGLLIADNFVKDGFSVLAISRPGYLGTPLPGIFTEFTPAQQADLIIALLDALNIPQVISLGFSAGGPVAFELARRYPGRVTALVLESIGQQPGDSLGYALLAGVLTQPVLPDFLSYMLYQSMRVDLYSVAKETLAQDTFLAAGPLAARTRFVVSHSTQYKFLKNIVMSTFPISPRLPGILNDFLGVNYWEGPAFNPAGFNIPTVIVQAVDDNNGYLPDALNVSAQIVGSQLIPVQESGHFIWLGPNTNAWQKQVAEFMNAHRPSGSFKPDSA